jgi:hypothetical protein
MKDKSFATRVSLRNKYHELLAEDGLDKIPISEEKVRESFEAMFDAGWYSDKTLTKEEAWAAVWAEKSNRFIGHFYDDLMNRLAQEVEEDIRLRGGVLPCPVYVGSWPIGYTNACAMPTADGVLVLLSDGLISLLYQVGKVFIHSHDWLKVEAPGVDPNRTISENLGWESYGWTMQRSIDALVAIFRSYFRDGSVTTAPRQQLPQITSARAMQLAATLHYAERFLVAHEYAHVLHEHCGPLVVCETPVGDLKDVLARSRQQELDADELAASLVLSSCDLTGSTHGSEVDGNTRVAGIMLLFACNLIHDVINEGAPGLALESSPYTTHPTANERAVCIFQYLERFGREFTVMGRIVMGWALPLSGFVAAQFHDERTKSGEMYPYFRGRYQPPRDDKAPLDLDPNCKESHE